MRDLPDKLKRLEQFVGSGLITLAYALERAAALGEEFEREDHRVDLNEFAHDMIAKVVPKTRSSQHRRSEALLSRWAFDGGFTVSEYMRARGFGPQVVAEAVRAYDLAVLEFKEKLRTSRPPIGGGPQADVRSADTTQQGATEP